jgi:hypothetical protein
MIREHIMIDARHGGPYDRGTADSYYGRQRQPHYFVGDSYKSPRIGRWDMTPDEVEAYHAGFDDNEADGDRKDWL